MTITHAIQSPTHAVDTVAVNAVQVLAWCYRATIKDAEEAWRISEDWRKSCVDLRAENGHLRDVLRRVMAYPMPTCGCRDIAMFLPDDLRAEAEEAGGTP